MAVSPPFPRILTLLHACFLRHPHTAAPAHILRAPARMASLTAQPLVAVAAAARMPRAQGKISPPPPFHPSAPESVGSQKNINLTVLTRHVANASAAIHTRQYQYSSTSFTTSPTCLPPMVKLTMCSAVGLNERYKRKRNAFHPCHPPHRQHVVRRPPLVMHHMQTNPRLLSVKPLLVTWRAFAQFTRPYRAAAPDPRRLARGRCGGRGSHWVTSELKLRHVARCSRQINDTNRGSSMRTRTEEGLSASYGIGGARKDCVARVKWVLRGCLWCVGCFCIRHGSSWAEM